jgi:predicted DNA-binding protein YlxM (UPF0122 family)
MADETAPLTTAEMLTRRMALQRAAQMAQTTRMKYAVQKNLKRTERSLEAYNETLQSIQAEEDVDPQKLQGALNALLFGQEMPEDVPGGLIEDLQELLQQEAGDPDVHSVPVEQLDREDDKGADFPFQIVSSLDFMIE